MAFFGKLGAYVLYEYSYVAADQLGTYVTKCAAGMAVFLAFSQSSVEFLLELHRLTYFSFI
ncbi:hypothetical protein FRC0190_02068 [Corynebacterium rouxii]|uniref:Uncharacterized protein n=1 Tax=Corynebacterium rouxii TaxID=2719119 RepID=A0A6I8MIP5_9CORY|nr:hypothetical protein FRC0190_02068 [Corynebacterium rouxii]